PADGTAGVGGAAGRLGGHVAAFGDPARPRLGQTGVRVTAGPRGVVQADRRVVPGQLHLGERHPDVGPGPGDVGLLPHCGTSQESGPCPVPSRQVAAPARARVTYRLAAARASGSASPDASRAATAAANVQPVPWLLRVSIRFSDNVVTEPACQTTSTQASPGRWPPLTTTQPAPVAASSSAAAVMPSTVDSWRPTSTDASRRFGVTTVACANSFR